jgi:DNA-binding NarL/FixJ family response regulator
VAASGAGDGVTGDAPVSRVLLVDDERLIRAGLRMLLTPAEDVEVVGEAEDGVEAVDACRRLSPDVVLMDVRMPRVDGIAATRQLQRLTPRPAVLVLTTFGLDEYVQEALRAGAVGFLLKDAPEARILAAVRGARAGVTSLDPAVTPALVAARPATGGGRPDDAGVASLTERELDVLRLVATGASNDDIARALSIGPATVKTHVSRVITKLGVQTRTQAAARAYDSGVVAPGGRRR